MTDATKADKLKFAFMMFDEDGSGFVEKKELMKILKYESINQSMFTFPFRSRPYVCQMTHAVSCCDKGRIECYV
jgi:hypothetical protein